ncbi:MAG: hypothetical protein NTV06_01560 [candidate division Zixibacteria bacterium]|nr:hypothetical protein [candidate division Zixibacteria bacterium]
MIRKLYLVVSGTIFGLVACLHLARLVFDWQAQVGTWIIPFWLSWCGLIGENLGFSVIFYKLPVTMIDYYANNTTSFF